MLKDHPGHFSAHHVHLHHVHLHHVPDITYSHVPIQGLESGNTELSLILFYLISNVVLLSIL